MLGYFNHDGKLDINFAITKINRKNFKVSVSLTHSLSYLSSAYIDAYKQQQKCHVCTLQRCILCFVSTDLVKITKLYKNNGKKKYTSIKIHK